MTLRTQPTKIVRARCARCLREAGQTHKPWCKAEGARRTKRTLHRGDPIILETKAGLAIPIVHLAQKLHALEPLTWHSLCGQEGLLYRYTDIFKDTAICVRCWQGRLA